jgi:hypothetical protein
MPMVYNTQNLGFLDDVESPSVWNDDLKNIQEFS